MLIRALLMNDMQKCNNNQICHELSNCLLYIGIFLNCESLNVHKGKYTENKLNDEECERNTMQPLVKHCISQHLNQLYRIHRSASPAFIALIYSAEPNVGGDTIQDINGITIYQFNFSLHT